MQQNLQQVHDELAGVDVPTATLVIDGKSLPINPVSRDPDARLGHTIGRQQLDVGYQLRANTLQPATALMRNAALCDREGFDRNPCPV